MAGVPHLAVPLRLTGAQIATVEQDSDEEIMQAVAAIVRTPLGHRTDLPEFGAIPQTHRSGGADLDEIERAVGEWEDRVDVRAWRDEGRLEELAAGLDRPIGEIT